MWMTEANEVGAELRALRGALRSNASREEINEILTHCDQCEVVRMHERERVFSLIKVEDLDNPSVPPSAYQEAARWSSANEQDETPRLSAIVAERDREYRSAMVPKEARPHREFKCITAYVELNGLKGLALLDSGSSIDCVSPDFA
ncbi:hypothetical protein QCA50_014711 [Cerrena zonata]|uniref:Uncharacterized protein n=1 Tax=Cerrena zonata TaxID=2478898 RepID=A0AAW0FL16_9APHY